MTTSHRYADLVPYHHGNLRLALLERAWEVVDEAGVQALSLRQLAKDVGVSHGASARHFPDRRSLIDAVAIDGFERFRIALADAGRSATATADRFQAVGAAYVGFATEHPHILELMYTAKRDPAASEELVAVSYAGMEMLVGMIRDAQQVGEMRAGDPESLAMISFAAIHGVAMLAAADLLDGVSTADATDLMTRFVWAGLDTESVRGDDDRPAVRRRR